MYCDMAMTKGAHGIHTKQQSGMATTDVAHPTLAMPILSTIEAMSNISCLTLCVLDASQQGVKISLKLATLIT